MDEKKQNHILTGSVSMLTIDETDLAKIISDNLHVLMAETGSTVADIANSTNISLPGLYKWLNGSRTPKLIVLIKISRNFGIPIHYFYEKNGISTYYSDRNKQDPFSQLKSVLSDSETKLVLAYRKIPVSSQQAILTITQDLSNKNS